MKPNQNRTWIQTIIDVLVVGAVSAVVIYVGQRRSEVELQKARLELEIRKEWMSQREDFELDIVSRVDAIVEAKTKNRYTSEDHKRFAEELQLRNSSLDVPDWDSIKDSAVESLGCQ